MTTFDERESSFETNSSMTRELQFKVMNRRNKLPGLWAANPLGIHGVEAETYAKTVVMPDFNKPGDQDVLVKVLGDFKAKGVEMSEHRLRKQMDELMDTATTQVRSEAQPPWSYRPNRRSSTGISRTILIHDGGRDLPPFCLSSRH